MLEKAPSVILTTNAREFDDIEEGIRGIRGRNPPGKTTAEPESAPAASAKA